MQRRLPPVLATVATAALLVLVLLAGPASGSTAAATTTTPSAAEGLAAAEVRLEQATGAMERLGLAGVGVDDARARARVARASGDETAMRAAADELDRLAAGAAGNGVQRLAAAAGFLVLAGFVVVLARRRSQWTLDGLADGARREPALLGARA